MPNPFAAAERHASAAADAIFGERVAVLPRAPGGLMAAMVDPARPPFETSAIVDDEGVHVPARGENATDAGRAEVSAPRCAASFDAACLPVPLKSGDLLRRIDHPAQPEYRIVRADPDGMGRVNAVLQRVGA